MGGGTGVTMMRRCDEVHGKHKHRGTVHGGI